MKARPKARPAASAKGKTNGNDSMSRKRKKGLKEWEDDTEDEEEDAEEEEDDEDDEDIGENGAGDESDASTNGKASVEPGNKSRPSNLRQRPARTSNVKPANPPKPESTRSNTAKGKSKASTAVGKQTEMADDEDEPSESSKENAAASAEDDGDEVQDTTHINGTSLKRRRTIAEAIKGVNDSGKDGVHQNIEANGEKEKRKEASPGKRRTRSRGAA